MQGTCSGISKETEWHLTWKATWMPFKLVKLQKIELQIDKIKVIHYVN